MRVLIQRVSEAFVRVESELVASIQQGLLILVGIESDDTEKDADYLVGKISGLRIFNDQHGKMNLSVQDVKGELLAVSQFTLHAQTKKGNRPSFIQAAPPVFALPFFNIFVEKLQSHSGIKVQKGVFGADMKVCLINDGPVTIWMDSKAP